MYKMIQLKKKVTRLKIQHFLKKNKLILFLHYNTQNISSRGTHTTRNQLLLNEPTDLLLIKNRIAQRLVLAQLSESVNTLINSRNTESNFTKDKPSKIKLLFQEAQCDSKISSQVTQEETKLFSSVKPAVELSCKKLLSRKKYKDLSLIRQEEPEKNKCQLVGGIQDNEQIEKEEQKGEKIACGLFSFTSKEEKRVLFHGPSALLGVVDTTGLLDVLKIYKQQDAFFLFGGLYDNQILDHTQIERLALLSKKKDNVLYLELVNCLQKPTLKALSTVQNCTPFFYLKKLQYGLIEIFNFRNSQLSMQSSQ